MSKSTISHLAPIVDDIVGKLFPDPQQRYEAQVTAFKELLAREPEINIAFEAAHQEQNEAESWILKNWRPILMLLFGGLITARWLGVVIPSISEAETLKLWSIVEFGLGSYVVGRSAEKIIPQVADAMKNRSQ